MTTRQKFGIGLMVFAVLMAIIVSSLGAKVFVSDVNPTAGSGGVYVWTIALDWNWFVLIPLGAVFLAGVLCLAIPFHGKRK